MAIKLFESSASRESSTCSERDTNPWLRVIEETMIKRGITGELSMTLEDNFMINRFLEAIGADRYKTYRIYRKQLPC